jgi:hypothetical protein
MSRRPAAHPADLPADALVDAHCGAPLAGVKGSTLQNREWRERMGISTFRIGRLVRFRVGDLIAWAATRREPRR